MSCAQPRHRALFVESPMLEVSEVIWGIWVVPGAPGGPFSCVFQPEPYGKTPRRFTIRPRGGPEGVPESPEGVLGRPWGVLGGVLG